MLKVILLIITIFYGSILFSQVIPDERIVDWETCNQHFIFCYPERQVNVKNFGAQGDGITNDYQAVANAIASLNGLNGYIYFPSGNYLIEETIYLPDSCVLKGESSQETRLIFNLGGNPVNCIVISSSQSANFTRLEDGFYKGSDLITVENNSGFNSGDYIEIRQKNGSWDTEPISWADYSIGQITRVNSLIGNNMLEIESPLRIDYDSLLNPEVRTINPVSNVGIQCLKIEREDEPTEGAGSNIYINMAVNCFIKGIESFKSVGSHISVNLSSNIKINGNYIHHAFTYDGTGTRGYGITLNMHSGEVIITNNILRYLRHALMVKTGVNGNVFGYNYSLEPVRTEPISDASGDVSLHGHYAFANLFEGNIVQNIIIDHYWGPSGPFNTFFRNQTELYGIIMTNNSIMETNYQNFVGNDITNNIYGLYILTGSDQFEYSNNVKGVITPTGTNTLNDKSYYLQSVPYFWHDSIPWPATGTPLSPGKHLIPAKARYLTGENFTICPDSVIINSPEKEKIQTEIIPNPVKDYLRINCSNNIQKVELISINNNAVLKINNNSNTNQLSIQMEQLPPGIYIAKIFCDNIIIRKIIKL